jgi:hypothetical protein
VIGGFMIGNTQPYGKETPDSGEALREEISDWIKTVREISENLPEPGSTGVYKEAFRSYQKYITEIASKLISYTKKKRTPQYSHLRRSEGRLHSAEEVKKAAKATAKKFENYSKRMNLYSEVESDLSLKLLLTELENLSDQC